MNKEAKRIVAALGLAGAFVMTAIPASMAAQHVRHHTKAATHQPSLEASSAYAHEPMWNDIQMMPGYEARPAGMCWNREGGGGQDLSGYWDHCASR